MTAVVFASQKEPLFSRFFCQLASLALVCGISQRLWWFRVLQIVAEDVLDCQLVSRALCLFISPLPLPELTPHPTYNFHS